jgi:RHS repeat-associated protein
VKSTYKEIDLITSNRFRKGFFGLVLFFGLNLFGTAAPDPLVNIPIVELSSTRSNLGMRGHTNDPEEVTFDMSNGDDTSREDNTGRQSRMNVTTLPVTVLNTSAIPHRDVTITVNEVYGPDTIPLKNIKVYLCTASGTRINQHETTNSRGQVTFHLPRKDYKVRADYMSVQYWSDVFIWQDTKVDIDHGRLDAHVTLNGLNVEDARVYLFTETGGFLGKYERTDEYGQAGFLIPAKSYKFRVDYEGTQYWSDVIGFIAHEKTGVQLPLDQLALNLTNDPNPIRYDGEPPIFEPEGIKVASIGSLTGILSQAVVANTPPPKVYYYLNDQLGRPLLMVDENNMVVWEAKYTPFGEAVVHPHSTVENNFRLPGQYYDEETGLHYNYHRYCDPRTGRYLTPDPIGLVGGINLFAYTDNNPVNQIDPFGLLILLKGSIEEKELLRKYLGRIAGTELEADCEGNVSGNFSSPAEFAETGDWLKELIVSDYTISIKFGNAFKYGGPSFDPATLSAILDYEYKSPNQKVFSYWGEGGILGSSYYNQPEAALAHELVGHGLDAIRTLPKGYIVNNQTNAVKRANKVRDLYGWSKRTRW